MKEVFSSQDREEDVKYTVCKYTGFRKNLAFRIPILEQNTVGCLLNIGNHNINSKKYMLKSIKYSNKNDRYDLKHI